MAFYFGYHAIDNHLNNAYQIR